MIFFPYCIFYVYLKRRGKADPPETWTFRIDIHIAKRTNCISCTHPSWRDDGISFTRRGSDCRANGGQSPYILLALSAPYIYNAVGFAARRCHRHINLTLLSEDSDSRGLANRKSNRGCAYGGEIIHVCGWVFWWHTHNRKYKQAQEVGSEWWIFQVSGCFRVPEHGEVANSKAAVTLALSWRKVPFTTGVSSLRHPRCRRRSDVLRRCVKHFSF